MKCARRQKLLPLYLENELTQRERLQLEAHFKECSDCQAILERLEKVSSWLASIPELEISPELQARLYSIPSTIPSGDKKQPFFLKIFLRPSLEPILAAASAILIFISLFLFHPDGRYLSLSFKEQFHLGFGQIEKLVTKAEGLPGYLPLVRESIEKSLKNIVQSSHQETEKI